MGFVTHFLGFPHPIHFVFASYCAHGPVSYHSWHVGPLGLLPLSLGFLNPFTLSLPFIVPMLAHWLVSYHFSHVGPLGLLPLPLGFLGPFTLSLPLIVPMGLLIVIPITLAHWVYYLFPWDSLAHSLCIYLLLRSWAC